MKNQALDIGEVARRSGLSPSTLRFYEEKGLIRATGRNGLRRLFGARILEQLEFIALGRRAGFTLNEIAKMFEGGRLKIDRQQLIRKADELLRSINQLKAVRKGLQHAAKCPAPSHLECPKFLKLLRVAGKYEAKQRPKKKKP